MPADPRQTARLRELHQHFAWRVNAAVAAGRTDLIDALCEEYAEEAVRLLTGTPPEDEPPPELRPPPGAAAGSAVRRRRRPSPGPPDAAAASAVGRWRALLGWSPRR